MFTNNFAKRRLRKEFIAESMFWFFLLLLKIKMFWSKTNLTKKINLTNLTKRPKKALLPEIEENRLVIMKQAKNLKSYKNYYFLKKLLTNLRNC